jgi:hypothetical protein
MKKQFYMKKYFNKALFVLLGLLFFAACKKEENNITYVGGTAPVLISSVASSDTIPLTPSDSTNTALSLSWTNPNYEFSNGISSLDVNYSIQIDTVGSNFTNPNISTISIPSSGLSTIITIGELNNQLGNYLLLATGMPHNIAVRVESYINSSSLPLYSNIFNYVVTPYAPPPKVALPTTGTLFIVGGDVLLGGWTNEVPTSQQFTQNPTNPTEYSIVITLSGGDPTQSSDQFSVTSQDGTWNGQYGVPSANLTSAYSSTGTFDANGVNGSGTNFPGPTAAGTYKIDLNFQTGVYTTTQQ